MVTENPVMNHLADLSKWTGYASCDTLPLSVFIDCVVDKAYHKLLPEGATAEEMQSLWLKLYSEYSTLSGSDSVASVVTQQGQAISLELKILSVKHILAQLYKRHSLTAIAMLEEWGYKLGEHEEYGEAYVADLDKIVAKLKGEEYRLGKLIDTLASTNGGSVTRKDFMKQLAALGKYQGYPIRERETMVSEYCVLVESMNEHIEAINNSNGG